MASSEARLRFLFSVTFVVPATLAAMHVFAPDSAARLFWGGKACSGNLPFGLLGSFWGAAAILSLVALREPLKWSPLIAMLTLYKLLFFATSILPLLLEGRAAEIPAIPAVVFFSFLPIMFACTPWAYLMGAGAGTGGKGGANGNKAE